MVEGSGGRRERQALEHLDADRAGHVEGLKIGRGQRDIEAIEAEGLLDALLEGAQTVLALP